MGLFDLEGTDPEEYPDNKGGRPPKDENEDEPKREPQAEEPWPVEGVDEDEYWQELWEKYDGSSSATHNVIADICQHTALAPTEVIYKLHTHDVYDFLEYDETSYSEWYVQRSGILDTKEAKQDQVMSMFGSDSGSDDSSSSSSSSSGFLEDEDDDDDEPSSGLQSLIDS